jgi:hypothetical protein
MAAPTREECLADLVEFMLAKAEENPPQPAVQPSAA